MTWRDVYAILEKIQWAPRQIVRKRLPLYVMIAGILALIYIALTFFTGDRRKIGNASYTSNAIFQSMLLLIMGYIPSFIYSDTYEQYYIEDQQLEKAVKSFVKDLPDSKKKKPKDEDNKKDKKGKKNEASGDAKTGTRRGEKSGDVQEKSASLIQKKASQKQQNSDENKAKDKKEAEEEKKDEEKRKEKLSKRSESKKSNTPSNASNSTELEVLTVY